MSFGEKGGIFFSFLNVLQLVGWTAIMIYDGALAANGVLHTGSLGMVSGNRCTDRTVDFYRHHKPWKNQHHRYGSTFYPHTGTLQAHLL